MALVTDEWNTVTFKLLSNAAWSSVPAGGLPAIVLQAVRDTSSLAIFVLDASDPIQFSYLGAGSTTVSLPAAVFLSDSPETTDVQLIDSSGERWYSMRGGDGSWRCYPNQAGVVFSVNDPTTLAAFLA